MADNESDEFILFASEEQENAYHRTRKSKSLSKEPRATNDGTPWGTQPPDAAHYAAAHHEARSSYKNHQEEKNSCTGDVSLILDRTPNQQLPSLRELEHLEQLETQQRQRQPDTDTTKGPYPYRRPDDVVPPRNVSSSADRNLDCSKSANATATFTSASQTTYSSSARATALSPPSSPEHRPPSPPLTQSLDVTTSSCRLEDDVEAQSNDTVINGRGIWNSWTRNFAVPLLALLDLLDNAFDANANLALLKKKGKISIQADREQVDSGSSRKGNITGIAIFNSSVNPIKPLHKVLEVYTSLKGASSESIGENGVGLKQGCATLSNLSFCLSCNRMDTRTAQGGRQREFSMGVIALHLQTDRKCSLPSFHFKSTDTVALREEMLHLFSDEYPELRDCIRLYGRSKHSYPCRDPEDQLLAGVDRLVKHFEYMTRKDKGWGRYHVFGLLLHELKHGPTCQLAAVVADDHTSQKNRVLKLLEQVYEDLPCRYLHIPTNLLDVLVGSKKVNFNYWQPRLVEMTQFDLEINKDVLISDDTFWKTPSMAPLQQRSSYYKIRIYIGWDALRVNNDKASKSASLYYYSRQSGRLIRKNDDARGELGLTNSGTDYCQGLTILMDDYSAHFPLNPTKQDLAFSEQTNGETHQRNLLAWVNAATRVYYKFYQNIIFAGQKKSITTALTDMVPHVNSCIGSSRTAFSSLSSCSFTKVGEFAGSVQDQGNIIRLIPLKSLVYDDGKDTKLRFPRLEANSMPRKRKALPAESEPSTNYRFNPTARPVRSLAQNYQQGPSTHETKLMQEVETLKAQIASIKHHHQTERSQNKMTFQHAQERDQKELRDKDATIQSLKEELCKDRELDLANKRKLLRLKQNISVLRQENDDLKSQVAGLEQTLRSKEQTILIQRSMIDKFDGEYEEMTDDGEEKVESGYRDIV